MKNESILDKGNVLVNNIFVKTILMLLVILGHSVHFWTNDWFTVSEPVFSSRILHIFSDWLNSFHIYAFTLVSGYIFASKMLGGDYASYISFIRNKVRRLLLPYFFAAFAWVIPISQIFIKDDIDLIIKKYIFCIAPSQLWFLWMLFGVFVIAYPLWNYISLPGISGWFISLFFYLIGSIGDNYLPNIFCIWMVLRYFVYFYVGVQICVRNEAGDLKLNNGIRWWIWLLFDICCFAMNVVLESACIMGIYEILQFSLNLIGAVGAFVVIQKCANVYVWKDIKWIRHLSKNSMTMYLFHQQLIYFSIVMFNGVVNPYFNVILNLFFAVSGSLLISFILFKFKVIRYLIGEK